MYHTNDPADQLGALLDALIEHQTDDPNLGSPSDWPEWTDAEVASLGSPSSADECFEPSPEDWKEYEDWLERLEYERGCKMRFV